MKIVANIIIKIIKCYKFLISPLLGNSCRYLPTCSEYTIQAIKKFGLIKGTTLSLNRISKCHPWGKGGFDPIKKEMGHRK